MIYLDETDSTNDYYHRNRSSIVLPACIISGFQTKGKGQGGSIWHSEKGKNLLFSFVFLPEYLDASESFYISKIIAISLAEVLGERLKNIKIKWPNDIFAGNKKIAGILIENSISGPHVIRSIAGVGMNLNQIAFPIFSPGPEATSMKLELGELVDKDKILNRILEKMKYWLGELNRKAYENIERNYHERLLNFSTWACYRAGNEEFEACITGVESNGSLKLKMRNGSTRKFTFKEVSFVNS